MPHNGDGARLKQTVNSVPTTYTQNLAAPLPVVLQAKTGTTTTLYLFDTRTRPLAEYDTAWEYLLPDGLGSVRQIADGNGNVTLSESYEPYGSVTSSQGSATSAFGYTGEQTDSYTQLVFLRARYYSVAAGQFFSRDPLFTFPLYLYASSNPINRIDPSGSIDWRLCTLGSDPRCVVEGPRPSKPSGDTLWSIAGQIRNTYYGPPSPNWPPGYQTIIDEIKRLNNIPPSSNLIRVGEKLRMREDWVLNVLRTQYPSELPTEIPDTLLGIQEYIEGYVLSAECVGQAVKGEEIVYDFVSKPPTRARFKFIGGGFTSAQGLEASSYVGVVGNLGTDIHTYGGSTQVGTLGVTFGFPAILALGLGLSYFESTTPSGPNGVTAYTSIGVGANPPGLNLNASAVLAQYSIVEQTLELYGTRDQPDLERLTSHISTGNNSPLKELNAFGEIVRPIAAWLGEDIVRRNYGSLP